LTHGAHSLDLGPNGMTCPIGVAGMTDADTSVRLDRPVQT
jgi:hypothetical protein